MDGSEPEQAAALELELGNSGGAGWPARAGAGAGLVELLVRHSVRVGGDLGQPEPREQRLHKGKRTAHTIGVSGF
jgi:hypothetical protein